MSEARISPARLRLEIKHHSSLIPEITVAAGAADVEVGIQIIDLDWTESDSARMVYRNVHAASKWHREGVAGRSCRGSADLRV